MSFKVDGKHTHSPI